MFLAKGCSAAARPSIAFSSDNQQILHENRRVRPAPYVLMIVGKTSDQIMSAGFNEPQPRRSV